MKSSQDARPSNTPTDRLNVAVAQAKGSFDEAAAYEAARKLFPSLGEREQRRKGYELLFQDVRTILGLTREDVALYDRLKTEMLQTHGENRRRLEKSLAELQRRLRSSESELRSSVDATMIARLASAHGIAAERALEVAEGTEASVRKQVETLKAQEAVIEQRLAGGATRQAADLGLLSNQHPLLAAFTDWRDSVLAGVRTSAERWESLERAQHIAEYWESKRGCD